MDPACETVLDAPDGAPVRVSVWAPAGVADEPGTPFGVAYEPAPVVLAGVAAEQAARLVPVLLEDGRSVVLASAPELSAAGVLQAMSRLGVTQAHVAGPLAGAVAAQAPARALSAAVPAVPAAEADAAELLDACDIPGRETCGWRRGFWPLPDDVSRRLHEGTTWVALERGHEQPGNHVLGAMSLDGDFGLPGVEPDWEPLAEDEMLTCHVLATDPAFHGRGMATALLAAYASEGIARGCKALRINT